jgi:hypothetical protein
MDVSVDLGLEWVDLFAGSRLVRACKYIAMKLKWLLILRVLKNLNY